VYDELHDKAHPARAHLAGDWETGLERPQRGALAYSRCPRVKEGAAVTWRAALLPIALLVVSAALAACAAATSVTESGSTGPGSPQVVGAGTPIGQMPLDVRKAELPSEFPIEIPVPDGRVLVAEQQSERVWVYEVALDGSVADSVAYYERALAAANWAVANKTVDADQASLLFVKGNAETTVDVASDPDGSHVSVAVGLGVPVGSTY
jgi:hypothetical protein